MTKERAKEIVRQSSVTATAYTRLDHIEDTYGLKKYGFSISDYDAAMNCFNELSRTGKTETFIEKVAEFFRSCGCGVSCGAVSYRITA